MQVPPIHCFKRSADRTDSRIESRVALAVAFRAAVVTLCLLASTLAGAQTGDGNIRGRVTHEQGAVLPGVTVTATGPGLLAPIVSVTDATGSCRLDGLPPGTFLVSAELAGFAVTAHEGIVMRAGLTFTIDITLKLSTLAETVTVVGSTPMIETSKATRALNVDGELLRAAPITARRLFSDALEMAPGVASRNVSDGAFVVLSI